MPPILSVVGTDRRRLCARPWDWAICLGGELVRIACKTSPVGFSIRFGRMFAQRGNPGWKSRKGTRRKLAGSGDASKGTNHRWRQALGSTGYRGYLRTERPLKDDWLFSGNGHET